jgi:ferritin-like metal-binding protein YciE
MSIGPRSNKSVKACKKSAKESKSASLKDAFTTHAEESAHQVERLTQVFEIIDKPARAKTCEATQGILAEWMRTLETSVAPKLRMTC